MKLESEFPLVVHCCMRQDGPVRVFDDDETPIEIATTDFCVFSDGFIESPEPAWFDAPLVTAMYQMALWSSALFRPLWQHSKVVSHYAHDDRTSQISLRGQSGLWLGRCGFEHGWDEDENRPHHNLWLQRALGLASESNSVFCNSSVSTEESCRPIESWMAVVYAQIGYEMHSTKLTTSQLCGGGYAETQVSMIWLPYSLCTASITAIEAFLSGKIEENGPLTKQGVQTNQFPDAVCALCKRKLQVGDSDDEACRQCRNESIDSVIGPFRVLLEIQHNEAAKQYKRAREMLSPWNHANWKELRESACKQWPHLGQTDHITIADHIIQWIDGHTPGLAKLERPLVPVTTVIELLEQSSTDVEGIAVADMFEALPKIDDRVVDIDKEDNGFAFQPSGDGFYVSAFGEFGQFSTRRAKGLIDIFRLVSSPGIPVSMRQLEETCAVVVALKQDAADAQTLAEAERDMRQLASELKECDSDEARDRMKSEFEQLAEYVQDAKGFNGRPRDLNNNELTALRTRIWNRMKHIFGDNRKRSTGELKPGVLKATMPKTARHLRNAIKVGDDSISYIYRPDKDSIVWNISVSDAKPH